MNRGGVEISADFERRFECSASLYRAPGRVNIIGGHSDYNDGLVLPTTTALYTWVAIAPRLDRIVRVFSSNYDEEASFSFDDIQHSSDNHWSDYVKGVAQILLESQQLEFGADILIEGELPIGGGLSSSASLETVVAYALLDTAEQEIDRRELAFLCQRAEAEFVGARCGIMDQYAISCGEHGNATLLDCRSMEHDSIPLPADLRIVVIDTGVKHQLAAGGLNARREECELAVAALSGRLPGIQSLRDVSADDLTRHRSILGDTLFRRARHVVKEIARVEQAAECLAAGNIATVGQLVSESHASLRDDYEVSCEELEVLVDIVLRCDGVHGARLVGAGFGGCAICIVAPDSVERVMDNVSQTYGKILGREPWMHLIAASGPVGDVEMNASDRKETAA